MQYKLTTADQAAALFTRFFPPARTLLRRELCLSGKDIRLTGEERAALLGELARKFGESVPENEFTTAELQGYLLSCKQSPEDAGDGVAEWVRQELHERRERKLKDDERRLGRQAKECVDETRGKESIADVETSVLPEGDHLQSISQPKLHASSILALTPPSTPPLGLKEPVPFVLKAEQVAPKATEL